MRPAAAERQITVEQWFGIAAEQILVARLADAEVERIEAALAAMPHQIEDQLLAGAFDGEAAAAMIELNMAQKRPSPTMPPMVATMMSSTDSA